MSEVQPREAGIEAARRMGDSTVWVVQREWRDPDKDEHCEMVGIYWTRAHAESVAGTYRAPWHVVRPYTITPAWGSYLSADPASALRAVLRHPEARDELKTMLLPGLPALAAQQVGRAVDALASGVEGERDG